MPQWHRPVSFVRPLLYSFRTILSGDGVRRTSAAPGASTNHTPEGNR